MLVSNTPAVTVIKKNRMRFSYCNEIAKEEEKKKGR